MVIDDDRALARWTLGTALAGGGVFFAVGAWRAVAAGQALLDHIGFVTAMGVLGFTVGGLLGPLLLGIVRRSRRS